MSSGGQHLIAVEVAWYRILKFRDVSNPRPSEVTRMGYMSSANNDRAISRDYPRRASVATQSSSVSRPKSLVENVL